MESNFFQLAGINHYELNWKWAFRHWLFTNMNEEQQYDCAVIGGGLAGLCSLYTTCPAKPFCNTFRKRTIPPFTKYAVNISAPRKAGISTETWAYRSPIWRAHHQKLIVFSPGWNRIETGITAGRIYQSLQNNQPFWKEKAVLQGVVLKKNIVKLKMFHLKMIHSEYLTTEGMFFSKNLLWKFWQKKQPGWQNGKPFIMQKSNKLNNFIGVKYHVKTDFPVDSIIAQFWRWLLRYFEGRMATIAFATPMPPTWNETNNSIAEMERNILYKTHTCRRYLLPAGILYDQPFVYFCKFPFSKNHR